MPKFVVKNPLPTKVLEVSVDFDEDSNVVVIKYNNIPVAWVRENNGAIAAWGMTKEQVKELSAAGVEFRDDLCNSNLIKID